MSTGRAAWDIKANSDELEGLRKDFEALADELESFDAIEALAEHARGQIIARTQKGKDFNDKDLRPYQRALFAQGRNDLGQFTKKRQVQSGSWAERREAAGLPTDHVNLTVSGTMLRAIDFDVLNALEAELYVRPDTGGGNDTPRDDVALGHQVGGRPWFGISPKGVKELERRWVGITLRAMMRRIEDARPVGAEIAQLNDRLELVTEPDGPFADYPL